MTSPNIVSQRLLDAIAQAGYVKEDGTPNKRDFARALARFCKEDPEDRRILEKWERLVYGWTSEGHARGMSERMAEISAQVLRRPTDYFKPETIYRELLDEREEFRRRLEYLEAAFQQLLDRQGERDP